MRAKGFTLIEILIAVFILGIVLSTVYASYTGTFRIIRATETDAELYGMARTVLERMTRDLEAVAAWKGAFTFTARPYYLGDREFTRLIFRSTAHIAFSEREEPAGIAVIEYGVEEGTEKEGYVLSRSDSLYRDPGKEEAPTGGFLMCDRVETLTYRFFDSAGNRIATDTVDGPSSFGMLSFGNTNTTGRLGLAFIAPATVAGASHAGADGANLAAGVYWVGVGGGGTVWGATNWSWVSTSTQAGVSGYNVRLGTQTLPLSLTATAVAGVAPAATPFLNGDTGNITATVQPTTPTSTGLTVTANLSAIGGPVSASFLDDGLLGDVAANDGIFTYQLTISGAAAGSTNTITVTADDNESPADSLPTTSVAISRAGNLGMPATFTDLGSADCTGASGGFTHVDGGAGGPWGDRIRWYKVTLPAAAAGVSSGSWVDIFTSNVGSIITDPEFAIFDNTGVKIAEDDQDGAGSHSAMSFGQTTPTRAAQGDGVAHNGRDGALAGGVIFQWLFGFDFSFGRDLTVRLRPLPSFPIVVSTTRTTPPTAMAVPRRPVMSLPLIVIVHLRFQLQTIQSGASLPL